MILINTSNIEQAKNQLKKADKPTIIYAQDDNFNRKILEYGKFDILLFSSNFLKQKKDRLKQIDSGFNHVLGKIASNKDITIGFDLNEIQQLGKKDKAIILSKIIQNIKICRKTKVKVIFINYEDINIPSNSVTPQSGISNRHSRTKGSIINGNVYKRNLSNLLISLGASTQQAIGSQL